MTSTETATHGDRRDGGAATSDDLETVRLVNGLSCELPANSPLAKLLHSQRTWIGPDAKERRQILRDAKSVAIVGASPNPARSSYFVSTYLQQSSDFRLYFVNPNATEILGQPAYTSLADLPEVPDIVDGVPSRQRHPRSHRRGASPSARRPSGCSSASGTRRPRTTASEQGLTVVMDRCIKVEHARFNGGLHLLGFDTGQITARKTLR